MSESQNVGLLYQYDVEIGRRTSEKCTDRLLLGPLIRLYSIYDVDWNILRSIYIYIYYNIDTQNERHTRTHQTTTGSYHYYYQGYLHRMDDESSSPQESEWSWSW